MNTLKFDKIINARDLGGIKVGDGRKVKSGLLLRTAYLVYASDEDLRRLKDEFHVRTVIDLRSQFEVPREPDRRVEGSEYVNIQVVPINGHLFKGVKLSPETASDFKANTLEFLQGPAAEMICDGFYVSFVDDDECQESFRQFFRVILERGDEPVLWHCSQGKDRTGLTAAFLLYALGADRETVLEDFSQSNVTYASDVAKISAALKAKGCTEAHLVIAQTLFGVNVDYFKDALDWIDTKYGGMQAYLRNQLRLSEQDICTLKNRYLEA